MSMTSTSGVRRLTVLSTSDDVIWWAVMAEAYGAFPIARDSAVQPHRFEATELKLFCRHIEIRCIAISFKSHRDQAVFHCVKVLFAYFSGHTTLYLDAT